MSDDSGTADVKTRRPHARQAAERFGRRSEWIATLLLIAKGYRILARRLRTPLGELDLVARSPSGLICFVEVKARETLDDALLALLPRQRERIVRAAEVFLARHLRFKPRGVRYDTITVVRGLWPRHFRDAWRP